MKIQFWSSYPLQPHSALHLIMWCSDRVVTGPQFKQHWKNLRKPVWSVRGKRTASYSNTSLSYIFPLLNHNRGCKWTKISRSTTTLLWNWDAWLQILFHSGENLFKIFYINGVMTFIKLLLLHVWAAWILQVDNLLYTPTYWGKFIADNWSYFFVYFWFFSVIH